MTSSERDLVTALRNELAGIDPARACDRFAEAAGLGLDVGSREPAVSRLVHRLRRAGEHDPAATADFAEGLAALLPCMWGYSELGRALAAKGLPAEPRYGRWIQTYADPEFAGLAAWCAALLDRAADGLPAARLAACERAFLTSLRHELAFWDVEEADPREGRH